RIDSIVHAQGDDLPITAIRMNLVVDSSGVGTFTAENVPTPTKEHQRSGLEKVIGGLKQSSESSIQTWKGYTIDGFFPIDSLVWVRTDGTNYWIRFNQGGMASDVML